MRRLIDYHTHSILSDGHAPYETMVCTAIEKGLDEIGFSDHVCLQPVSWAIDEIDFPVMTEQIFKVREKYGHLINIKYGIELDYFPGREEELRKIIESLPLDYVIGSVHFIDGWNFDSDRSLYGKWTNDSLYEMYYGIVKQAIESNLFDIIGHIDIIKKFCIYPESDQTSLYEETAGLLLEKNLVVELNTGGLDRPCADFNPEQQWIEILYAHGIPVTITSDAHYPQQIGRHFEEGVALLKKTGYRRIATFKRRKMDFIKI